MSTAVELSFHELLLLHTSVKRELEYSSMLIETENAASYFILRHNTLLELEKKLFTELIRQK